MLAYAVQQLEPQQALWLGLARFNKGKEGAAAASDQGLPAAAGSVQAQQLQPRHAPTGCAEARRWQQRAPTQLG